MDKQQFRLFLEDNLETTFYCEPDSCPLARWLTYVEAKPVTVGLSYWHLKGNSPQVLNAWAYLFRKAFDNAYPIEATGAQALEVLNALSE